MSRFRSLCSKRLLLVAALTILASVLPLSTAAGQTPVARSTLNVPFKGVTAPGSTFDLVQSVVDFGPGARSHVMTTATPHYLSVLEGELTVEVDGKAEAVAAGEFDRARQLTEEAIRLRGSE